MLKQTQSQKLLQKILPQVIQKQNLLAIPTLSLEQLVKLELEQNPFLEEVTESEEESVESEEEDKDLSNENETTNEENTAEEFDWEDFSNTETEGYKTEEFNYSEKPNYENLYKSRVTLRDILISQINLSELNDLKIFIGEEIIGNLDDDGYVKETNEELLQELNKIKIGTEFENSEINVDMIAEVRKVIMEFEPPGIASENLKECLLVQIRLADEDEDFKLLCKRVLESYLEEFRLKNYEKLMKELGIDKTTVKRIFEFISKLNPKPGYIDEEDTQNIIYPDLLIIRDEDGYRIELNDKNFPSLKINNTYKKLISGKRNKLSKDAREFIINNFDRAKWFLDSIKSRRETILKVMKSILERQKEFFDNKGEGLRPMYEKDVAEDINMDISTVSRTVRGKYVQTDFGIFELKYFFSNYVRSNEGDDVSTKEIKHKIKEIIDNEDSSKPFTDDEIVNELQKQGYKIARRTIAKYRDMMKIPKARLRRKI